MLTETIKPYSEYEVRHEIDKIKQLRIMMHTANYDSKLSNDEYAA